MAVIDDCVEWPKYKKPSGYGQIMLGPKGQRRCVRAHRWVWEQIHGPIPAGLCVLHRCDNRACVNPQHLFLGTQLDNIADKVAKDRQQKGERVPNARLREQDVRTIRSSVASQRELAKHFGVDQSTISDVVRRKHWRHI